MTTQHATIIHIPAERRYSGVTSSYEVSVRGRLGHLHNANYWQSRGRYEGYHGWREADTAALRAADEPGVIEVKVEEINAPGPMGMPLIMDRARDYGA